MVDRIATFTQTSSILSDTMRLQSKYAKTQTQISSGQISDSYQGIASKAPQILSLESDYSKILAQSESAQTALDRTEIIYDTLDSIVSVGQGFLDDLSASISGTGVDTDTLILQAEENLEQIVSYMNTQTTGRYIFSGSATSTAPIDLTSYTGTNSITLPSSSDTSYYQGNDYTQSIEIDTGYSVDYGITANNDAFEEIIRAFDLIINSQSTSDPDTALEEAFDLLGTALDDLEDVKAKTSQASQTLDQYIDDSLTELNLIDSMIADLKEVDLAEVSVKLQELETQLEASYSITTRLLQLNLSDYL